MMLLAIVRQPAVTNVFLVDKETNKPVRRLIQDTLEFCLGFASGYSMAVGPKEIEHFACDKGDAFSVKWESLMVNR